MSENERGKRPVAKPGEWVHWTRLRGPCHDSHVPQCDRLKNGIRKRCCTFFPWRLAGEWRKCSGCWMRLEQDNQEFRKRIGEQ